jgi:hypothetical protein
MNRDNYYRYYLLLRIFEPFSDLRLPVAVRAVGDQPSQACPFTHRLDDRYGWIGRLDRFNANYFISINE